MEQMHPGKWIIYDDNGKLFQKYAGTFAEEGYCVKRFSMTDVSNSNCFNPVELCLAPGTGVPDAERIREISEALLERTTSLEDDLIHLFFEGVLRFIIQFFDKEYWNLKTVYDCMRIITEELGEKNALFQVLQANDFGSFSRNKLLRLAALLGEYTAFYALSEKADLTCTAYKVKSRNTSMEIISFSRGEHQELIRTEENLLSEKFDGDKSVVFLDYPKNRLQGQYCLTMILEKELKKRKFTENWIPFSAKEVPLQDSSIRITVKRFSNYSIDRETVIKKVLKASGSSAKEDALQDDCSSCNNKGSLEKYDDFIEKYRTPAEIKRYLDNHVYGQEEAKKAASIILYRHSRGQACRHMFTGPTGCGKTEIWRALREIYPYICIFDVSSVTNDGWTGEVKSYSCYNLIREIEGDDKALIEKYIIVLDEADKMMIPRYSRYGDNVSASVQYEFLTMVEGKMLRIGRRGLIEENTIIDTSKNSFVFVGAFEALRKEKEKHSNTGGGFGFLGAEDAPEEEGMTIKDLIRGGMIPELAGRVGKVTSVSALSAEDFVRIALDERFGCLRKVERSYGLRLGIDHSQLLQIAQEAVRTGLGVRYMQTQIERIADELIYDTGIPEDLPDESDRPGDEYKSKCA